MSPHEPTGLPSTLPLDPDPEASTRPDVAHPNSTTVSFGGPDGSAERTVDFIPREFAEMIRLGRAVAGRYRIERTLGDGGFGVVYLAYDLELRRAVALKVTRAVSRAEGERLLDEGRKLAQLDHPGIVPVYDCGYLDDGAFYLVSKYIGGGDLAGRLAARRPTIAEAIRIAEQVAGALGHAHERGIIHRDVKPRNILLDAQGAAHLCDFGLALDAAARSEANHIEGSPYYMSPEQAGGRSRMADERTDVFSLGIILYELLTGRRPFEGDSLASILDKLLHAPASPPRRLNPEIPASVERICLRALEKDPQARYQSAAELERDLRDAAGPNPRDARRRFLWFALAAGLVLAAVGATVVGLALRAAQRRHAADRHERRVAEWVLRRGGRVDVVDHLPPTIHQIRDLPRSPFTLRCVTLHAVKPLSPGDIADLCALRGLYHLQLSDTDIPDVALASIGRLRTLKRLWVNYNELADEGIVHLARLKDLEWLNLGWTNVSDDGVEAISGAKGLIFLDLSNTMITDRALTWVRDLPRLRTLLLEKTAITDACVDDMGRLGALQELDISETRLTRAGRDRLKKALPNCRIVE